MTQKTSKEWLDGVLTNNTIGEWLQRQYIGEMGAARRIDELAVEVGKKMHPSADIAEFEYARVVFIGLSWIAIDESKHAKLVKRLLDVREISVVEDTQETRYWKPVLEGTNTIGSLLAAGYHAETMRLERIVAITEHPDVPRDIKEVFTIILGDERKHAAWFASVSTQEDLDKALPAHQAGMEALSLVM